MTPLIFTFDVMGFRTFFPAFGNPSQFTDATLEMNWDIATAYICDVNLGRLQGKARFRALNLMTAHLTQLGVIIAAGEVPGVVQQTGIDKVSVSLVPPPERDQWQWWLNQTPYGQQLIALLQVNVVGGYYIGGSPELSAFRRVGNLW